MDERHDMKPKLRDDLRRIHGTKIEVPIYVDQRVLGRIRQDFARRQRVRRVLHWTAGVAAAAAVILVVFWTRFPARNPAPDVEVARTARVDVLDAFHLARLLQSQTPTDPRWDYNRDGVVNDRDVQAIAMAAVRLQPGDEQ